MLKLFKEPQSFIYSVNPGGKYIASFLCVSDNEQQHNAGIVSIKFIGVEPALIKNKEIGLFQSETEGFWFYISSESGRKRNRKEFSIPKGCRTIKLEVKDWNVRGSMYLSQDFELTAYNDEHESNSFKNKIRARMAGKESADCKNILSALDNKNQAYDFAFSHGFKVPHKLAQWDSLESISFDLLPSKFVFKPLWAHTNKGVFIIEKIDNGKFFDRMRNKFFSFDEIKSELLKDLQSINVNSNHYFAEELLVDAHNQEIPMDYRVYSFFGKVGMIMQRNLKGSSNPNDWKFKFYNRNWDDLGKIKFAGRVDCNLPKPVHHDAMIKYAEALSSLIKVPFIRVDLYDTPNGIVLGELTPTPGGYDQYDFTTDQTLGEYWNQANIRLKNNFSN